MAISCGSQIVLCDVPIRMDTYTGCSHGCKYCFAKKKQDISKIKKDATAERLKDFIAGRRTKETAWCDWDIPLHWGGLSDPFQPCEKRHRASLAALKVFAETGYPFIVSTKGRLVAAPEYLELMRQCNAVVQISMICEKYDKLEPGAPTFNERLEICRKVAPNCKRLIVRIQPYMVDVLQDVLQNIPKFKDAGVYGITIEGLKTSNPLNGFVKVGGDFAYPVDVLKMHYDKIRRACNDVGLHFYCAENRLRSMGESLCCCGCDGLDGFKVNTFNINHVMAGETVSCSDCMKKAGTAEPFKSIYQYTGSGPIIDRNSMLSMMLSEKIYFTYKYIMSEQKEQKTNIKNYIMVAKWLKSRGFTANEINRITGSCMGSHYLCVNPDGEVAIPTPEQFDKIRESPKCKNIPSNIQALIYSARRESKKLNSQDKYDASFMRNLIANYSDKN